MIQTTEDEIREVIDFYDVRGWSWVNAVAFIACGKPARKLPIKIMAGRPREKGVMK